jgi:hypothetical protein
MLDTSVDEVIAVIGPMECPRGGIILAQMLALIFRYGSSTLRPSIVLVPRCAGGRMAAYLRLATPMVVFNCWTLKEGYRANGNNWAHPC